MSANNPMSVGPQVAMPGAFQFDGSTNSGSPTLTGAHPNLFRPPVSSSPSSSVHLAKSTASMLSDSSTPTANAKRKRSRPFAVRDPTPLNDWTLPSESTVFPTSSNPAAQVPSNSFRQNGFRHNINQQRQGPRQQPGQQIEPELPSARHYMLAGQVDTLNAGTNGANDVPSGGLDNSAYSDADYRRELGSKRHCDSFLDDGPTPPLTQNMNCNDLPPNQTPPDGWSRFALNAIGEVVGKVWEFCRTGAFGGFYAGGGLGYDMDGNAIAVPSPSASDPASTSGIPQEEAPDMPVNNDIYRNFDTTMDCDPSSFPVSDYNPYTSEDRSTPESTPPPAPKRRQVSDNHDDLRRNWVLVNDAPKTSSTTNTASSRVSTAPSVPRPRNPSGRRRINSSAFSVNASSNSTTAAAPAAASTSSARPASRTSMIATPTRGSSRPSYCAPTASSSSRRISVPVSRINTNTTASNPNPPPSPSPSRSRRSIIPTVSRPASAAGAAPPATATASSMGGGSVTPSRGARRRAPSTGATFLRPTGEPASYASQRSPVQGSFRTEGPSTPSSYRRQSSRVNRGSRSGTPSRASSRAGLLGPGGGGGQGGNPFAGNGAGSPGHRRSGSALSSSSATGTGTGAGVGNLRGAKGMSATVGGGMKKRGGLGGLHFPCVSGPTGAVGSVGGVSGGNGTAGGPGPDVGAGGALSGDDFVHESPRLTIEGRELAKRRQEENWEVESRMDAMAMDLQDLIRNAKEALGTKVEVEFQGPGAAGGRGGGGRWVDE